MTNISTHVLDLTSGKPAAGVPVVLKVDAGGKWVTLASYVTGDDGRCRELLSAEHSLCTGLYCLYFDTGAYFAATHAQGLYPYVEIVFNVMDAASHHHIPLLLAANGYSTYRGS